MSKNIGLIIAGGVGARMGQEIPKQFLSVNDRPVIVYTLEAFQRHPEIDEICVVCVHGWEDVLRAYARQFGIAKLDKIVTGGKNGPDSIRNGIQFIQDYRILIHPRCVNFLTEISNYTWDTDRFGRRLNVPIDDFNHLMDAMRYALEDILSGPAFSFD